MPSENMLASTFSPDKVFLLTRRAAHTSGSYTSYSNIFIPDTYEEFVENFRTLFSMIPIDTVTGAYLVLRCLDDETMHKPIRKVAFASIGDIIDIIIIDRKCLLCKVYSEIQSEVQKRIKDIESRHPSPYSEWNQVYQQFRNALLRFVENGGAKMKLHEYLHQQYPMLSDMLFVKTNGPDNKIEDYQDITKRIPTRLMNYFSIRGTNGTNTSTQENIDEFVTLVNETCHKCIQLLEDGVIDNSNANKYLLDLMRQYCAFIVKHVRDKTVIDEVFIQNTRNKFLLELKNLLPNQ